MQTSLKTLLLLCVYVAVCMLVYVHSNLWLGTLVVVVTIIWLVAASIHAFRHENYFSLGFSLCAWAWLVFWLGFYAETRPNSGAWHLPHAIYRTANLFREMPKYDPKLGHATFGEMQSLHISGPMATQTGRPYVPSFPNAIRLAVCVTALFVGLVGGAITHRVMRRKIAAWSECGSLARLR